MLVIFSCYEFFASVFDRNIYSFIHFDLEITNGNYYLSDIFEIALIAEESGNAFHSYITLQYSVPKRERQLTGITNKTIKSLGLPFRGVMDGLVDFLQHEQVQSGTTTPVIIEHGGYSHDFPIFLANCMKLSFSPYSASRVYARR